MFGKDYPKEYIAERKGEQRNSKCDTDWTNRVIDWKPKKSLSKYIKRSISE
jgi:nucleoside-diphosphate-sugar epimerase